MDLVSCHITNHSSSADDKAKSEWADSVSEVDTSKRHQEVWNKLSEAFNIAHSVKTSNKWSMLAHESHKMFLKSVSIVTFFLMSLDDPTTVETDRAVS